MIGYVHCQRSFTSAEFSPEKKRGYAPTSLSSPVRRFKRVRNDPLLAPAQKMSGSVACGAMEPGSPPPTWYGATTFAPPPPPPPPPAFVLLGTHSVLLSCCAPQ